MIYMREAGPEDLNLVPRNLYIETILFRIGLYYDVIDK